MYVGCGCMYVGCGLASQKSIQYTVQYDSKNTSLNSIILNTSFLCLLCGRPPARERIWLSYGYHMAIIRIRIRIRI